MLKSDQTVSHLSLSGKELKSLELILGSIVASQDFLERAEGLWSSIKQRRTGKEYDLDPCKVEAETPVLLSTIDSGEAAGLLTPSEAFFFKVFAVERVHERRWFNGQYSEIEAFSARMTQIEKREGLNEGEAWVRGEGPKDYWDLAEQYEQALDVRFEQTLRELDLETIADLFGGNREVFDARRESGRTRVFDHITELQEIGAVQERFEAEAKACADNGAYMAAAVMVGSAMEAALLLACLKAKDQALAARDRLPMDERPRNRDPKRWRLAELVRVTHEAGWLPDFSVSDWVLRSIGLLERVRHLRNLVHPARHLQSGNFGDMQRLYESAQATYSLLRRFLGDPSLLRPPK